MFFAPTSARGSFVVHFTSNPVTDFGIWGRGYTEAAKRLRESLLSGPRGGDNDTYPVVFLYRHALELYLKGIMVAANHVVGLKSQLEFVEALRSDHRLLPLFQAASRLLLRSFPDDPGISDFLAKLKKVVTDLNGVDPGSFSFRYPVNTEFERPAGGSITMGLIELGQGMDEVLEAFDTIETALQVEGDDLEEALAYLEHDDHDRYAQS